MLMPLRESNPASAPALPAPPDAAFDRLAALEQLVVDAVPSPKTKTLYRAAVREFLAWYADEQPGAFSKAVVQRYRSALEARGLAASSVNVRLAAIRKLANEAADNGLLATETATAIARVKGAKRLGVKLGNWLSQAQAQQLLEQPGTDTLKGLRDTALLAVMLGAGLRRSELAALTVDHVQQREGRWVIVDLEGKHGRVRSVPIASWVKAALDRWTAAAAIEAGCVFRAVNKGDRVAGAGMTPQAIYNTLAVYAEALGLLLAPHDLRRTFAQLARKADASLEQIQLTLGHASVQTTERYLGTRQDLADAPSDRIKLRV